MTGEVTLQGRVLPIGGLKQKALAAHAAGLTDVIIPERNRADLDDVPDEVREQVKFHPVMSLEEVLELALEPLPRPHMRCRSCSPLSEQVRDVADLLERRWTISILFASHEGAVRFNEFLQVLGRVPPATLTSRLGELERAGVLERRVIDARPPGVEYRLTPRGRQLGPLVLALRQYAARPAVESRRPKDTWFGRRLNQVSDLSSTQRDESHEPGSESEPGPEREPGSGRRAREEPPVTSSETDGQAEAVADQLVGERLVHRPGGDDHTGPQQHDVGDDRRQLLDVLGRDDRRQLRLLARHRGDRLDQQLPPGEVEARARLVEDEE